MITYNQCIMEISPSTVTGLLGLGGAGYMLGNQMTSNDAGTTTMPSNPVGYLGDQAGKLKEWWDKPGIFSALKTLRLFFPFFYYIWTFKKHIPSDKPLFSKNLL